jgi:hypothetical protein
VVQGTRLEERIVETGDALGDDVVILRGIAPGDRIAKTPNGDVRDGVRVQ